MAFFPLPGKKPTQHTPLKKNPKTKTHPNKLKTNKPNWKTFYDLPLKTRYLWNIIFYWDFAFVFVCLFKEMHCDGGTAHWITKAKKKKVTVYKYVLEYTKL